MNLLGYLVTLANIQSFANDGPPLTDMTVRVSEMHRLVEEIKSLPEFSYDCFRETGFYRVGNVGKYLSNNLREYMYKGGVDPRDEGVIITLYFGKEAEQYYEGSEGTNGARIYNNSPLQGEDQRYGVDNYYQRKKRAIVSYYPFVSV